MEHLRQFENALMNVLMKAFLNSDFVGTKAIEIIISSDQSTVRIIEDED